MLGDHPDFYQPFRKEMGFFLFNWHRGETWYRAAFAGMKPGQIGLDATPEYFFSPEATRRIESFGPAVRVLLGLREPAELALSLYHEYAKRFRVPPLADFLRGFRYQRGSTVIEVKLAEHTIPRMVEFYRACFAKNLLLYDFATFAREPLTLLQTLESFLSVSPYFTRETFRNRYLSVGDRPNSRLLSYVASRESLIGIASELFPAQWLRAGARLLYESAPSRPSPNRRAPTSQEQSLLEGMFLEDRVYIRSLFSEGPMVDGEGTVRRTWDGVPRYATST